MEKTCSKCQVSKGLSEFFSRGGKEKHLLKSACKECMIKMRGEWGQENRDRVRELNKQSWEKAGRRYKRRNITEAQWLEKVAEQNGVCAICKEEDELVIDHNHLTNEFRGALCRNCNRAIGLLGDSISVLQNAVEYLQQKGSYGDIDGREEQP